MDITAYSAKLKGLDDKINDLRSEKEQLEYDLHKKKTTIAGEIDKEKFKSNQIRENFINLAIVNDLQCDIMAVRLLKVQKELREVCADHAKTRRDYRVLENEYLAHGIRRFEDIEKKE